jgi:hypothetical protein
MACCLALVQSIDTISSRLNTALIDYPTIPKAVPLQHFSSQDDNVKTQFWYLPPIVTSLAHVLTVHLAYKILAQLS